MNSKHETTRSLREFSELISKLGSKKTSVKPRYSTLYGNHRKTENPGGNNPKESSRLNVNVSARRGKKEGIRSANFIRAALRPSHEVAPLATSEQSSYRSNRLQDITDNCGNIKAECKPEKVSTKSEKESKPEKGSAKSEKESKPEKGSAKSEKESKPEKGSAKSEKESKPEKGSAKSEKESSKAEEKNIKPEEDTNSWMVIYELSKRLLSSKSKSNSKESSTPSLRMDIPSLRTPRGTPTLHELSHVDLSRECFSYSCAVNMGAWPDQCLDFLQVNQAAYLDLCSIYGEISDIFDFSLRRAVLEMEQIVSESSESDLSSIREYLNYPDRMIEENYWEHLRSEDNCYMRELEDHDRSPKENHHYLLTKALREYINYLYPDHQPTIPKQSYAFPNQGNVKRKFNPDDLTLSIYLALFDLRQAHCLIDDFPRHVLISQIEDSSNIVSPFDGIFLGMIEDFKIHLGRIESLQKRSSTFRKVELMQNSKEQVVPQVEIQDNDQGEILAKIETPKSELRSRSRSSTPAPRFIRFSSPSLKGEKGPPTPDAITTKKPSQDATTSDSVKNKADSSTENPSALPKQSAHKISQTRKRTRSRSICASELKKSFNPACIIDRINILIDLLEHYVDRSHQLLCSLCGPEVNTRFFSDPHVRTDLYISWLSPNRREQVTYVHKYFRYLYDQRSSRSNLIRSRGYRELQADLSTISNKYIIGSNFDPDRWRPHYSRTDQGEYQLSPHLKGSWSVNSHPWS